jgi:hypothetical protein
MISYCYFTRNMRFLIQELVPLLHDSEVKSTLEWVTKLYRMLRNKKTYCNFHYVVGQASAGAAEIMGEIFHIPIAIKIVVREILRHLRSFDHHEDPIAGS